MRSRRLEATGPLPEVRTMGSTKLVDIGVNDRRLVEARLLARAWRVWGGYLGNQRPRFNTAYHSAEVRDRRCRL
ncbi:MAG TPA: hypothetical protein VJN50_01780 [Actinomycetota bacterium]|nr:hypothetical protein [Actinomycetota bacterium]